MSSALNVLQVGDTAAQWYFHRAGSSQSPPPPPPPSLLHDSSMSSDSNHSTQTASLLPKAELADVYQIKMEVLDHLKQEYVQGATSPLSRDGRQLRDLLLRTTAKTSAEQVAGKTLLALAGQTGDSKSPDTRLARGALDSPVPDQTPDAQSVGSLKKEMEGSGGGGEGDEDEGRRPKKVRHKKRVNGSKVCLVCGDKALAHNFDVITCESCKAFFRRNALKSQALHRCMFQNNCAIDKNTRRFCPACRLKKCFDIGMKVELMLDEEERRMRREKRAQRIQQQTAGSNSSSSSTKDEGNSSGGCLPEPHNTAATDAQLHTSTFSPNSNPNTPVNPSTLISPNTHANPNTHSNTNTHVNTSSHGHTNPDVNLNPHVNLNTHSNPNTHVDSIPHLGQSSLSTSAVRSQPGPSSFSSASSFTGHPLPSLQTLQSPLRHHYSSSSSQPSSLCGHGSSTAGISARLGADSSGGVGGIDSIDGGGDVSAGGGSGGGAGGDGGFGGSGGGVGVGHSSDPSPEEASLFSTFITNLSTTFPLNFAPGHFAQPPTTALAGFGSGFALGLSPGMESSRESYQSGSWAVENPQRNEEEREESMSPCPEPHMLTTEYPLPGPGARLFTHVPRDQLPSDPFKYWLVSAEERLALANLTNAYQEVLLSLPERSLRRNTRLDDTYQIQDFLNEIDDAMHKIVQFSKHIVDFRQMRKEDQIAMLKASAIHTFGIACCAVYVHERDCWLSLRGDLTSSHLRKLTNDDPYIQIGVEYCRSVKSLVKNDFTIYALVHCMILFDPRDAKILDSQAINRTRDKYVIMLKHYLESQYSYLYADVYFVAIQERVREIITLAKSGNAMFKRYSSAFQPLITEMLSST